MVGSLAFKNLSWKIRFLVRQTLHMVDRDTGSAVLLGEVCWLCTRVMPPPPPRWVSTFWGPIWPSPSWVVWAVRPVLLESGFFPWWELGRLIMWMVVGASVLPLQCGLCPAVSGALGPSQALAAETDIVNSPRAVPRGWFCLQCPGHAWHRVPSLCLLSPDDEGDRASCSAQWPVVSDLGLWPYSCWVVCLFFNWSVGSH